VTLLSAGATTPPTTPVTVVTVGVTMVVAGARVREMTLVTGAGACVDTGTVATADTTVVAIFGSVCGAEAIRLGTAWETTATVFDTRWGADASVEETVCETACGAWAAVFEIVCGAWAAVFETVWGA
jgi:hypothetical protein